MIFSLLSASTVDLETGESSSVACNIHNIHRKGLSHRTSQLHSSDGSFIILLFLLAYATIAELTVARNHFKWYCFKLFQSYVGSKLSLEYS